ncbi:TOPRS ligase, partial [Columbina picui]|nr:TOPRS ligase [Columbina picui]
MATEPEWSCPICQDARSDIASAMPCQHQFCLGCILRWTERRPECPLCRRPIASIRFSEQDEGDYLLFVVSDESPDASNQARTAPGSPAENSPQHPVPSPPSSPGEMPSPAEQGAAGPQAVGGLLPEVWAELFQRQEHLLDPVLPWLRQQLQAIYGSRWWLARTAESLMLHALCLSGLDGEAMVHMMQDFLEEHTGALVHGVISIIVSQCREEAQRLLRSQAAQEEENSTAAGSGSSSSSSSSSSSRSSSASSFSSSSTSSSSSSSCTSSREGTPDSSLASSSSSAGSDVEEQPSSSEASLCRDPSCPLSVPFPAEQEQPQEDLRQAVAPGPSAQGCSYSPSAPSRGRDSSPGGPRRPPKRRNPDPQDSPRPCKSPPQQRH